jgi:hypothetical protein
MPKPKVTPFTRLQPQVINQMIDIEETMEDIYRKVSYIAKIIRDHEDEDGCLQHGS